MADMPTCGTCTHYRKIEGTEIQAWQGECRRHAPAPGNVAKWPQVVENELACGEFAATPHKEQNRGK